MHIRWRFRSRHKLKHRDTFEGLDPGAGIPGRKGPKFSREASLDGGEKSCAYVK